MPFLSLLVRADRRTVSMHCCELLPSLLCIRFRPQCYLHCATQPLTLCFPVEGDFAGALASLLPASHSCFFPFFFFFFFFFHLHPFFSPLSYNFLFSPFFEGCQTLPSRPRGISHCCQHQPRSDSFVSLAFSCLI